MSAGTNAAGDIVAEISEFKPKLDRTNDAITTYQSACTATVVDLATDADVVVSASPAVLLGIFVNTVLSAHVAPIKDNATALITLPASTAAGTNLSFPSITYATNLTVESDNSATGNITVFWRAL